MSTQTLITRTANRFGVDAGKLLETLKATAFKQRDGGAPTNEQLFALLVVAEQYNLNPFTREIYAFPDRNLGIVPVVGVDGWLRILNEQPHYNGIKFIYAEEVVQPPGSKVESPLWIECIIYHKDRTHPTEIREYLNEVYRAPVTRPNGQVIEGPWQTHTKRQLRHKALIQAIRVAFGFGGLYDAEDAERVCERSRGEESSITTTPALEIDHKTVDPILQKLTDRAVKESLWSAAQEYAQRRFKGAELSYALEHLRQAEQHSLATSGKEPSANSAVCLALPIRKTAQS
jgi:phage recombination protein Bet